MAISIEQETDLEDTIDRTSLQVLLEAIQEICNGKADHFQIDWQDPIGAKAWLQAAKALDRAINKAADLAL